MCRVRRLAKRVQYQHVQAFEQGPRSVGNAAAIGQVGEAAQAQAKNGALAVENRNGHNLLTAEAERPTDREQLELGQATRVRRRGVEDVREQPAHVVDGGPVAEARHGTSLHDVETPDIVETQDVIVSRPTKLRHLFFLSILRGRSPGYDRNFLSTLGVHQIAFHCLNGNS